MPPLSKRPIVLLAAVAILLAAQCHQSVAMVTPDADSDGGDTVSDLPVSRPWPGSRMKRSMSTDDMLVDHLKLERAAQFDHGVDMDHLDGPSSLADLNPRLEHAFQVARGNTYAVQAALNRFQTIPKNLWLFYMAPGDTVRAADFVPPAAAPRSAGGSCRDTLRIERMFDRVQDPLNRQCISLAQLLHPEEKGWKFNVISDWAGLDALLYGGCYFNEEVLGGLTNLERAAAQADSAFVKRTFATSPDVVSIAYRSDMVRYFLLKWYGGMWVDASIILFESLDWVIDISMDQSVDFVTYYVPVEDYVQWESKSDLKEENYFLHRDLWRARAIWKPAVYIHKLVPENYFIASSPKSDWITGWFANVQEFMEGQFAAAEAVVGAGNLGMAVDGSQRDALNEAINGYNIATVKRYLLATVYGGQRKLSGAIRELDAKFGNMDLAKETAEFWKSGYSWGYLMMYKHLVKLGKAIEYKELDNPNRTIQPFLRKYVGDKAISRFHDHCTNWHYYQLVGEDLRRNNPTTNPCSDVLVRSDRGGNAYFLSGALHRMFKRGDTAEENQTFKNTIFKWVMERSIEISEARQTDWCSVTHAPEVVEARLMLRTVANQRLLKMSHWSRIGIKERHDCEHDADEEIAAAAAAADQDRGAAARAAKEKCKKLPLEMYNQCLQSPRTCQLDIRFVPNWNPML